ncbi:hypothetical protein K3495_g4844 [Podosphaera aphanis]|nr:hypothetical protein K3495_g4844 [Podosphaera aphanis]
MLNFRRSRSGSGLTLENEIDSTDSENGEDIPSNPAASQSQFPVNLSDNIGAGGAGSPLLEEDYSTPTGGVGDTTLGDLEETSGQIENLESGTESSESPAVPNISVDSQVPNVRRSSRQRTQIAPRSAWQPKSGALYVERDTHCYWLNPLLVVWATLRAQPCHLPEGKKGASLKKLGSAYLKE